jgi:putative ABC transport system permease protein
MASSAQTRTIRQGWPLLPGVLVLAGQRVRKTWGLLLAIELGMLGAVLLACVVPLYANIAMTAALRGTLNSSTQASDIVVRTQPQLISTQVISQTTNALNNELGRTLGNYLAPVQFSIESQLLPISSARMGLISAEMSSAAAHLSLVAGRLPRPSNSTLEIAITPQTAQVLHIGIGSVLQTTVNFTDVYNKLYPQFLALHVVGLFTPDGGGDPFWHGDTFAPYLNQGITVYALIPNETLLGTFASLSNAAAVRDRVFASTPDVLWYYRLDPTRIAIGDLNSLVAGIQQVQVDNANNPNLEQSPYLEQTQTYLPSPSALNGLAARISVIEFPVISLVVMIFALILFFIGLLVNLLVERQSEAIALLRSRGASRGQIQFALVLQAILLGLIALAAGLLLALWVTHLLTWQMFAGNDQGALNIIAGGLPQAMPLAGPYALLTIVVALLTVILTVWGASRRDIVSLRRETARPTRRPLWQRLRLDIVAVIITLTGYGFSVYLQHSNALNSQLYLLLISPLALLQVIFLLLAGLLILFRFYPLILRLGSRLAARRRSAAPVLALAQIARAPRRPVSMTLLLALASAFAIFSLIFTASQTQRVHDISAYQAGADFSGAIPTAVYSTADLARETRLYSRIPGVLAASLGYNNEAQAGASLNLPINFQAVDAATFAQAAIWTAQDSSQPLTSLMRQLLTQRNAAIQQNIVPAIVDANTISTLHLVPGANFDLQFSDISSGTMLALKVVAEVQHIPTSGNTLLPGVLVDYPTFANVYTGHFQTMAGSDVALNYVWLRTRDDARSLASVRKALTTGELSLSPLYDRRAIESTLFTDPIYLTLIGELELGAITALFLALLGCLTASWLSVRNRLTNFLALRALGATPRQVVSTLAWEQGIIYIAALILGIIFGALLATLSLPALVLTSVLPSQTTGSVSNTDFYAAQFVPPLQTIIPASLWLALAALIAICLLALGLMVFKVARSSISLVLRLSED